MNIFVCIKQVPDTETKIKITADSSGIDEAGVKWVMNPYDEFAVEEAIKLKSSTEGANLVVVSLGPKKRVVDSIRTALAMGADTGIVIDTENFCDSNITAKALAEVIKSEGDFSAVFTGKLAIDDNASSVSQQLAYYLEVPHTTVVSKFESDGQNYTVEREVEGGTKEVVQLSAPAVIGANKGLNQPRYASLPGIMKAKKKPLKEVELSSLSVSDSDLKLTYDGFKLPAEKPPVKMLDGDSDAQAKQLTQLLRDEAKVI